MYFLLSQSDAKPTPSRFGYWDFPALGACYVYLLRVLIGFSQLFKSLWLAIMIALGLFLWHSIGQSSALTCFLRIAPFRKNYVGKHNVIYNNVTTLCVERRSTLFPNQEGSLLFEIIGDVPLERVWLARSFVLSKVQFLCLVPYFFLLVKCFGRNECNRFRLKCIVFIRYQNTSPSVLDVFVKCMNTLYTCTTLIKRPYPPPNNFLVFSLDN